MWRPHFSHMSGIEFFFCQALLHAHMLEARREGLLAPLLELLRHASSADEARVAESAATTLLAAHQSLPLRALTNEAERALANQRPERAREALLEAIALDETHAETWVRLADLDLGERLVTPQFARHICHTAPLLRPLSCAHLFARTCLRAPVCAHLFFAHLFFAHFRAHRSPVSSS